MTRSLLLTSPTLANAARRSLFAMALSIAALGQAWAQSTVPWQVDTYYAAGTVVSYEGRLYRALVNQVNWAATGWNPNTTALWTPVSGSATAPSSPPSRAATSIDVAFDALITELAIIAPITNP